MLGAFDRDWERVVTPEAGSKSAQSSGGKAAALEEARVTEGARGVRGVRGVPLRDGTGDGVGDGEEDESSVVVANGVFRGVVGREADVKSTKGTEDGPAEGWRTFSECSLLICCMLGNVRPPGTY